MRPAKEVLLSYRKGVAKRGYATMANLITLITRHQVPLGKYLNHLCYNDFGAEAGIVLRGIAERFDRSGDSHFPVVGGSAGCLLLFGCLCLSPYRLGRESNTLITPGRRPPAFSGRAGTHMESSWTSQTHTALLSMGKQRRGGFLK